LKRLILISFVITINIALAQHKTLTVYYNGDSTKVVNLSNTDSLVLFVCGASKINYGGKAYNTVLIGDQCWLKENLNIGTMVLGSESQTNNGVIEKYCYNNLESNCSIYGGLYQWDEAMQYVEIEGVKGICPDGWHIPTYAEFQTLKTTVNSDGNALKEVGQGVASGAGTNTSGFSALLAGDRSQFGNFRNLGYYLNFWSSTSENATWNAYSMYTYYSNSDIYFYDGNKNYGYSVRCLKD
jgi:uncharacterized protein (TIGR02145 family)